MKRFLVITLSWITLAISPSASAFDCNKAKLSVEKIICKDAELSELDDTLNVSYQYALKQNNEKLQILNTQRQWLYIVRNRCRTATCLKHAYVTRINEITLVSSFDVATQNPSPNSTASSAPKNTNQSTVPQCENQTYSHGEYTGKYLGAVTERSLYPHCAKFIQETSSGRTFN